MQLLKKDENKEEEEKTRANSKPEATSPQEKEDSQSSPHAEKQPVEDELQDMKDIKELLMRNSMVIKEMRKTLIDINK